MKAVLSTFLQDESGATAIEYGLIATCIALALITALHQLGLSLIDVFNRLASALS
jgi:pilus assembly protein Flp/PilA